MSRRHDIQSVDGVVVAEAPARANFVIKAVAPTASAAGFAKGCLWINTAGAVGSTIYINDGTVTVAVWTPLTTKVDTALGFIPLPLPSWRLVASNDVPAIAVASGNGGNLGVDTSPKLIRVSTSTDKALRIIWASSTSIEIFNQFYYPPDMDVTAPYTVNCRIGKSANTDATCTFTVGLFEGVGDTTRGSATAVLGATAVTTYTSTITPTTGHPMFANVTLTPGTHTTDDIWLYEAYVLYKKKALLT